jgi:adenylosuccinate synthase
MLKSSEPIYEELKGWTTEIKGVRRVSDLPVNAQRYLRRIEQLTRTRISMVSIGEERNETIEVKNPFQKGRRLAPRGVPKSRSGNGVKKRKK